MNPKERMLQALYGGRPDQVPVAPSYLQLYLENSIGRNYLTAYRQRMGQRRQMPIDHEQDSEFRANAFYQALGIFEEPLDWFPVLKLGPDYDWASDHFVERVGGDHYFVHRRNGRRLSFQDALPMVCNPGLGDLAGEWVPGLDDETRDLWDLSAGIGGVAEVQEAVPICSVEEMRAAGEFELAERQVRDYGDSRFLYAHVLTPYDGLYDLLGFAGMMLGLHDRPELLPAIMERKLAQSVETLKGLAAAGIHGVWIIQTLASADLISREHFIDFALPGLQRLVDEIKALNMVTILYFCSDAIPRLDLLRGLGVDAIALEESKKNFHIDIEEVVDRVGDEVCVFGNIDAIGIMAQASPEIIERKVMRQIEAGKRARGFVLGIGSPLPRETDPRQVDLLVRAARKHGQLHTQPAGQTSAGKERWV